MGTVAGGVAIAGLVVAAAGTAATVVGQARSADAQAKQAAYAAQVASNNALIGGYNAQQAEEKGQAEVQANALKTRAIHGSILAAEAAGGTDVNSGSDVNVVQSQRGTGQIDTATIQHNAFLQAYGYNVAGLGYTSQAELSRSTAANATGLLPVTAAATGLEGASAIGSKWNSFVQSGAFGSSSAPVDDSIT